MADDQELTEQTVTINGIEHTMMLSADDAERYAQAEEARNAAAESATGDGGSASTKAKTPDNKSKTSTASK